MSVVSGDGLTVKYGDSDVLSQCDSSATSPGENHPCACGRACDVVEQCCPRRHHHVHVSGSGHGPSLMHDRELADPGLRTARRFCGKCRSKQRHSGAMHQHDAVRHRSQRRHRIRRDCRHAENDERRSHGRFRRHVQGAMRPAYGDTLATTLALVGVDKDPEQSAGFAALGGQVVILAGSDERIL